MLVLAFDSEDYRKYEMAEIMNKQIKINFYNNIPNNNTPNFIFSGFTELYRLWNSKVVGGNYNVLATDIFKQVIGQQNFYGSAVEYSL